VPLIFDSRRDNHRSSRKLENTKESAGTRIQLGKEMANDVKAEDATSNGCNVEPTNIKTRKSMRQKNPCRPFSPSSVKDIICVGKEVANKKQPSDGSKKNTAKKSNGCRNEIKSKPTCTKIDTQEDYTAPIITLTVPQIRKAAKNPKQKCDNNILLHVPSVLERTKIYNEAAIAISRKEALALPSNGSRPWQCQVHISDGLGGLSDVDTTWTQPGFTNLSFKGKKSGESDGGSRSAKKKKYPPLFRWYRNKLELAVLPHFLEMIEVVEVDFGNLEDDDASQDGSQDEDMDYNVSTTSTDLTEREVSMLSRLAWEDINHLIPEIERKWISPDQFVFRSRRKVLKHAEMLMERDKLIDRVMHGHGVRGKKLQPIKPTRNKALEAGYYRFLRDGLWVIGQEEDWLTERLEELKLKVAQKKRKKEIQDGDNDETSQSADHPMEEKHLGKNGKKWSNMIVHGKHWRLTSKQIILCYNAIIDQYEKVMSTIKARALHYELADGFDIFRERGRGRFDMQLPVFDTPKFSFLTDSEKNPWMEVVKKILGDDAMLVHKGAFLSLPGSEKQVYHQDGTHLTTKCQRPCHAINVFIPLVDLTEYNGPTEFCLGTHFLGYEYYTRDMVETPVMKGGTPFIFDYRLGHRGLANTTTQCRPVVYLTYTSASSEFRDSVNFSNKRYRKLGDLIEKPMSRQERALKRSRE